MLIHILHYVWYVLKHKFFVFCYMAQYGMYYAGFMHDMSKFTRREFMAYVRFFEEEGASRSHGYTIEEIGNKKVLDEFNRARDWHKTHNPHHWEYWVTTEKVNEMPYDKVVEMICDWRSVAKVLRHNSDASPWYKSQCNSIKLAKRTRIVVEYIVLKEAA